MLPPEPTPISYPPSEESPKTPPSPPIPEVDAVYKYDFFEDIAQYNKYYLNEKLLWQVGGRKWDDEVYGIPKEIRGEIAGEDYKRGDYRMKYQKKGGEAEQNQVPEQTESDQESLEGYYRIYFIKEVKYGTDLI